MEGRVRAELAVLKCDQSSLLPDNATEGLMIL